MSVLRQANTEADGLKAMLLGAQGQEACVTRMDGF
jgi:hypothetical protein